MSRSRGLWIGGAFAVAAAAGVVARVWLWPAAAAVEPVADETPAAAVAVTEELVLEPADLYFPSLAGGLKLHRQDLPSGEPLDRVRFLVEALIDGPAGVSDGDLYPPFPEGTSLASVYALHGNAVAVDLRSRPTAASTDAAADASAADEVSDGPAPRVSERPAWGSEDEILTVYSLVNTVTLNRLEGVDRVVILWDGRQPETFAGHLDVSRPLAPDPSWVVSAP